MLTVAGHVSVRSKPTVRRNASIDVAIAAGAYLSVYFLMRFADLPRAGACAVLAALTVATWRLRVRGESWRTLGLAKPESLVRLAVAVFVLYVIVVASVLALVEPLAQIAGWRALDLSTYADLPGNPLALATILLIAWTTAAIGEELLFRGFLLTRLENLLRRTRAPFLPFPRDAGEGTGDHSTFFHTALAVILQAAIFGIAHWYLGAKGVATAMMVGAIYGVWYVLRGRNLLPLIIAHGLTDTVSLVAIYAGVLA